MVSINGSNRPPPPPPLGVESTSSNPKILMTLFFSSPAFLSGLRCAKASVAARWRRMWPPKAWPMANSSPQMVHSCTLGLAASPWPRPSSASFGFLWLARWPPNAWNDGNCRLHVLHSKTRAGGDPNDTSASPWDRSISARAMFLVLSISPPSSATNLFMPS